MNRDKILVPAPSMPAAIRSEIRLSPRWQAMPLTTEELKQLRVAEFNLGRELAQLAITKLHPAADFPQGESKFHLRQKGDRSPEWPTGFVGSISHSDHWVWVAAARISDYLSIGIDTELLVTRARARELRDSIAGNDEWERLSILQLDENVAFTLLFSAKESFFKMCYPLTQAMWDFRDVELIGQPAFFISAADSEFLLSGTVSLRTVYGASKPTRVQTGSSTDMDLTRSHVIRFYLDQTEVFTECSMRSGSFPKEGERVRQPFDENRDL